VFGPGLFKNDDDRRRTTSENCSDKELLEEIPEYNKTRRVTFADIGELHTKFAPKSTWSLNGKPSTYHKLNDKLFHTL
jgi:hypothetical protein